MLVLLLPLHRPDARTREKDGERMNRLLNWLRRYLLHVDRAETSHQGELNAEEATRMAVFDDMSRRDRSVDRRIEALEQSRRDNSVDRRIEALEQFAEQLKQRPQR